MTSKVSSGRMAGTLLGTALGDSLGLPAEGMRPRTIERLGWNRTLRQRLFGRRGMWSDDTEHAIMLAQAFLASEGDDQEFARRFSRELRWWIVGLPAGTGKATAQAIIRLWLGFPPAKSGVFSAGNGPCMRAPLLGLLFPENVEARHTFTTTHTHITHRDPKALTPALVLADLAALLGKSDFPPTWENILPLLTPAVVDAEWERIIGVLDEFHQSDQSLEQFLEKIGGSAPRGITGYSYHTAACVIAAGIRHEWKFGPTISALIQAGGDTDTTAAIAGALCGALHGLEGLPSDSLRAVSEWPTSCADLERLAKALTDGQHLRIRPYWSPTLFVRNLFFLSIVLGHGLLRLLPASIRRHLASHKTPS